MGDLNGRVEKAVRALVEDGTERGVQVAVYRHGELVVDVAAGDADPETGRKVEAGTPFYNFSIGKGATSTVVHVLVERGLVGYDTPVAVVWPEFGARGKGGVTVRHVLTHSAGVPGIPLDVMPEDLCDWDGMCARIAGSELWWEPGTKIGYHSYTFGYILGEVVRRVTGKPISQVLREEVGGPLGVADELYFGMPESEHPRLARLEDAEGAEVAEAMTAALPPDHPMLKAGPWSTFPTAELGSRTDILTADIPAGGKTSARAIARMYAAMLGEVDGVRLISPERLSEVTAEAASGVDEVFGMASTWGLGYSLSALPGAPDGAPVTTFGMGGAGGSLAYGDPGNGVAFALTKNRLSADFTTAGRISEIVAGG